MTSLKALTQDTLSHHSRRPEENHRHDSYLTPLVPHIAPPFNTII